MLAMTAFLRINILRVNNFQFHEIYFFYKFHNFFKDPDNNNEPITCKTNPEYCFIETKCPPYSQGCLDVKVFGKLAHSRPENQKSRGKKITREIK